MCLSMRPILLLLLCLILGIDRIVVKRQLIHYIMYEIINFGQAFPELIIPMETETLYAVVYL